jgi:hypothetical protein
MIDIDLNEICEASPRPVQTLNSTFLVTDSELRDRKTNRRRKREGHSEAIRQLVCLRAKGKQEY